MVPSLPKSMVASAFSPTPDVDTTVPRPNLSWTTRTASGRRSRPTTQLMRIGEVETLDPGPGEVAVRDLRVPPGDNVSRRPSGGG